MQPDITHPAGSSVAHRDSRQKRRGGSLTYGAGCGPYHCAVAAMAAERGRGAGAGPKGCPHPRPRASLQRANLTFPSMMLWAAWSGAVQGLTRRGAPARARLSRVLALMLSVCLACSDVVRLFVFLSDALPFGFPTRMAGRGVRLPRNLGKGSGPTKGGPTLCPSGAGTERAPVCCALLSDSFDDSDALLFHSSDDSDALCFSFS